MIHTKKGFTLIEMMIVLALIGLFFTMMSYMTRDVRTYQTSADRLANSIYDTIRTARNNMIIGRGVFSGTTLVVTTQRRIDITTTGLISTYQYNNGTNNGVESQLVSPFFENDPQYKITDIAVSSGGITPGALSWDQTGSTIASAAITISPNSDIAITGTSTTNSPITPIRTLKITAGYNGFEQSVIIDRVSGAVEIRKAIED